MTKPDELFMLRALELAELGAGYTRPNPMVGCVVVHNNRIIGEGWHRKYGGPHAEVNAINSVEDKQLLPESTVYVTLEPCSHFGKTPPCADLLVKHQVKKVVICNNDPNPLVAGRGIARLQHAGIEVETGCLVEKGRELNRRFFTFHEKLRPYIILKWAQTSDGFIAKPNFEQVQISGPVAKKLVHKWRGEEAAIMVGTRTAEYDNPKLDVRDWAGQNPLRIVVDRNLNLPESLNLFDKSLPTLVYNMQKSEILHENLELVHLNPDFDLIPQVMDDLFQRQVQSVLVEGGTYLLESFIESEFWDEARIFRSLKRLGSGIAAPKLSLNTLSGTELIGEDELYLHINDYYRMNND